MEVFYIELIFCVNFLGRIWIDDIIIKISLV